MDNNLINFVLVIGSLVGVVLFVCAMFDQYHVEARKNAGKLTKSADRPKSPTEM